jgi:hypothetical protein
MTNKKKQNKREYFTFYRSFYEALKELPQESNYKIYNAIFEYAFNFNKPDLTLFTSIEKTIWLLIEPNITKSVSQYNNGTKPKTSQHEAKTEPRTSEDKDRDKDEDKEKITGGLESVVFFNFGKSKEQEVINVFTELYPFIQPELKEYKDSLVNWCAKVKRYQFNLDQKFHANPYTIAMEFVCRLAKKQQKPELINLAEKYVGFIEKRLNIEY